MNPDRPLVEVGPEFTAKQVELRTLAALLSYFRMCLTDVGIHDAVLVNDLMARWQDSYLNLVIE